jgi:hypothetical protein
VLLGDPEQPFDLNGAQSAVARVAAAGDVQQRQDAVEDPLVVGPAVGGRLLIENCVPRFSSYATS